MCEEEEYNSDSITTTIGSSSSSNSSNSISDSSSVNTVVDGEKNNEECDADWNPGKIVYYGRGELKQSDHRPVIAMVDVDVHCILEGKRDYVFRDAIRDLGPPDGTIVVCVDENCDDVENIFEENFMNALVQDISEIGEIILVRFVNDTIWITFRDGRSALSAVQKGVTKVCGHQLQLTLKSPDWVTYIEKEIDSFKHIEDSDRNLAIMNSMTEKVENLSTTSKNLETSNLNRSPPPRPSPPVRPPQPVLSDTASTSNTKLLATDELSTLLPNSLIYEEIPEQLFNSSTSEQKDVDYSEHNELFNFTKDTPPPLPIRQLPLPPPETPPPALPTNLPPPVPARSSGGPPIPARNIN